MCANLVVKVVNAATGAVIPYVSVDVDGVGLATGLDGTAIFVVPAGATKTIKVRSIAYRPWSYSVPITSDRVTVTASLERATL